MKAIWQLVDTTIIPILTYASEGWECTKEEIRRIQTIFNEALKTILFLPQGTPTSILLTETGYLPMEEIIKKKQIMQAHRILNMKKNTLIKQAVTNENSLWMSKIKNIMIQLNITKKLEDVKKNELKQLIEKATIAKQTASIKAETENKTKTKHWWNNTNPIKVGERPKYMDQLSRKECNAIIKTRASMLPVKMNQKAQYKENTKCRFCEESPETQEHVMDQCKKAPRTDERTSYHEVFHNDNITNLKSLATKIISLNESLL